MRKSCLLIIMTLIMCFVLFGCDIVDNPNDDQNDNKENVTIDIFSLNDFHGALYETEDNAGIAKIGQYLINQKQRNPENTIILSSGDMFQGTALSSMTRGKAVVDAMNIIGFDVMTLGNHEFDWGVDAIKVFHDDNEENGEAEFPFIAANIALKATGETVDWVEPYYIIEKSGVKIGVIGVIGEDQINDILTSIVEPYEFTSQIDAVKKYAKELRTTQGCDIVIVSTHSGVSYRDTDNISNTFTGDVAKLTGDEKVDAVFNAHTHAYYSGEINYRGRTAPLPYVQSGSSGTYIGKISLEYSFKDKEVVDSSATNLRTKNVCTAESDDIMDALESYSAENTAANEFLGEVSWECSRDALGIWGALVLMNYYDAEVGVVNEGGIRTSISSGDVSYGDIFAVSPFDNRVVIVYITGSQLTAATQISGLVVQYQGTIDSSKTYKVALIDYVYEKTYYPFINGTDATYTDDIFRDVLAQEIKNSHEENGYWDIYDISGPVL